MKRLWNRIVNSAVRAVFFCIYLPLAIIYRPKVTYTDENAKKALRSPCIIVCNHTSHKDGLLISRLLLKYKAFTFVARDWYEKPSLKPLFSNLNFLPIDRNSMDTQWLEAGLNKLSEGHPILIFPEGRTSKSGVMNQFHPGFLYIAKRAGVPVIPVCLLCDYKLFHRQRLIVGSEFKRDLHVKGRPSVILSAYAAECRGEIEELIKANGGPIALDEAAATPNDSETAEAAEVQAEQENEKAVTAQK